MAQIFTSIALYQTLQKHGKSEEETYKIKSEEMWKALTPKSYQKMARLPFFIPMMKKILPFGFKHGSGVGWRYEWHIDEDPKDRFHFEKIIDGMKCHTVEEIEDALKSAGFSNVKSDHHNSKPWITVIARK